ncbi:MAG: hypothetical protein JW874_07025 [Spirochaetales bacterium]|nr:hypothetical protein [Spirochaetales bacterium]
MDRNLEYVFSPLNSVDLKSLQKVADSLRNSHKKPEKAIGVFLSRLVTYRAGELSGGNSDSGTSKTISSETTSSRIQKNTGLRDLY